MRYLIIREQNSYREYPLGASGVIHGETYTLDTHKLYFGKEQIAPFAWTTIGPHQLLFLEEEEQYYERKKRIFLSEVNGDIRIADCKAKIYIEDGQMQVEESGDTSLFLNQEPIGDGRYPLEPGAILLIGSCKVIVGEETLTIRGTHYDTHMLPVEQGVRGLEKFPYYQRSPRLIKRIEEKTISIEAEPKVQKMGKKALLQTILPPVGMLLVTVGIGLLLKRGSMVLLSASATGMTLIFSVTKYVQDRKEHKTKEQKKQEVYGAYLLDKRKEIYHQWQKEADAYAYNYPRFSELTAMVNSYRARIYERTSMDEDFLTFCAGHYLGATTCTIKDKVDPLSLTTSPFAEEVKSIRRKFATIDQPQIIDLKKANVGLVGEKGVIHEQLQYYISQLSFAQSYHDVQFVVICSKEHRERFAWMRWLSHSRIQGLNVLGIIHTEKMRDQILSSMQQILKDRRQRVEESKKEARFLPHYVFVIDEPKMIVDHSIMEFLSGDAWKSLGFSLIYTSHLEANLPDTIGTVLLLEDSMEGRLLLKEKELCNQRLHLNRVTTTDLEQYARNLGVLVHEQGMTSHIPERITFFDLYGIRHPKELQICKRWTEHNSSKTLAVPLGARAVGDLLELNLHEKAHGPHGLVAGTTGSGKSEIVQSYILSLAVNFHPHEVGFLLIDYKGGGMANLFRNLPHLLGTITNLDGSESMRALASIQSELRRRQRIFGEHDVNHINAYNDLYKEGQASEPIPHLFIISDEFAELKKEQPEFMKELVSTARIGRSLGVHLILATQKPTGVVDDQIWTNSKFKLCLKVQNEADSKEVLHTPDAANITQPGRSYLQVGNNEIYELFQSAWSGAMYIEETEREVTQDNRVYLVNALGQGELINQDLRGTKEEQKAKETQLDVVVDHIKQVYEALNSIQVMRPWLPSLPEKMVNPYRDCKGSDKVDLEVVMGMRDIPEEQQQEEYSLDLSKHGNIIYTASSGYGKSVFLTNAALHLAVKNGVSHLNLYILDFGNNALITLSKLPHVAAYIMLDDEERYMKFKELIQREVKERKKKLAAIMAQNFNVYNETALEPLKAIVILMDNYDAVKEMGIEEEDYYTKLIRDGVGLGIYVIVTASKHNAVRIASLNNFKNKLAGFNFDSNEVTNLIGRSNYTLPEIPGRALVKVGENATMIQLYTPVDFVGEVDYNKNVQKRVEQIALSYPDEEAPQIPILPEELDEEAFFTYDWMKEGISIGLNKKHVLRTGFQEQESPFLIVGDGGSGKTNVVKLILNQLVDQSKVYLVDSISKGLYHYQEKVEYIRTTEELEDFTNYLNDEMKKRKIIMNNELANGKPPQEIWDDMEEIYVVIDDIEDLATLGGAKMPFIAARLKRAMSYGITFIVTANVDRFRGQDEFTLFMKTTRNGLLLSTQSYLTLFPLKQGQTPPEKPDAFLMIGGKGEDIRIPQVM